MTFSGDKLLGGAQAGLVLGRRRHLDRVRRDPLARALRLDKLALATLEATLPLYADPEAAGREVPVLAMLRARPEDLEPRARHIALAIAVRVPGLEARVSEAAGEVGGGSLPRVRLPGPIVELRHPRWPAADLERRARTAEPPVIGTVRGGAFRIDPRTLLPDEDASCIEALARAFADPAAG